MNNIIKKLVFVGLLVVSGRIICHSGVDQSSRIVSFDVARHFDAVMRICRDNCKKLGQCNGFKPEDSRACLGLKNKLKSPVALKKYKVEVLEKQETVFGFVQYTMSLDLLPPSITLLSVGSVKGEGFGTRLLLHAEKEIMSSGGKSVILSTTTENVGARAFYAKHDYLPHDYPGFLIKNL